MFSSITERIRKAIEQREMLRPGDRLAIAVSGGADSVALLRLFVPLRKELGLTLSVLHFNHQLRGTESDTDENFVASLANALGLPFIAGRADVASVARENRWNLEDAARRLRYQFFEDTLKQHGITRVMTAHTADDQAETVLARLIRGTGISGLSAIHPVRGEIIRPLLDVRRDELRGYLESLHQEWREDSSNADTDRLRARIRSRLLPELEQHFSASIVGNLKTLAGLACDEEQFWKMLVENRCAEIVTAGNGMRRVNTKSLLLPLEGILKIGASSSSHALSLRIIRKLHADVAVSPGELSRRHVERVVELARSGSSGQCLHLPGGVRVCRELHRLAFLAADRANIKVVTECGNSYCYPVELPKKSFATVSIAEVGRSFRLKVIDWPVQERETIKEGAVLDAQRLRPPLILRNWRPGDAYRPRGRQRERKLVRMLMTRRISRPERALWPVFTSADRIVWADRMPPAAEFCATEATRMALWISENPR